MLTYGSVCSGIEAATAAWHPIGFTPLWFSEIEKFPCGVLSHHYPNVPNLGDMTLISDLVNRGVVEAPDVLVGGTPCQSFSVAGLRKGLEDARGNLTLAYVTLLDAIDEKRLKNGDAPSIAIWENVPGVLSSKDNAFGCFLGALVGEPEALQSSRGTWSNAGFINGQKRRIAWRILDAQFFGVAQRRRRVFVIASARDDIGVEQILFECESLRRDTPPSRSERKSATCFTSSSFAQYREGVGTLTASGGDLGGGSDNLITYALAENIIGRKPKNGGNGGGVSEELSYTLNATGVHAVACNYQVRRLTPIECERLQGFEDGYTKLSNATPDGPRYKALGNSMAVPVMRWIGARLYMHLLGLL